MRRYYGGNRRREYFEGWYFRQQAEGQVIAIIPAMHIDAVGVKSASIQVITNSAADRVIFPFEEFCAAPNGFVVTVGGNRFSEEGICVNIRTDTLHVRGELVYGMLTLPKYDMMGPFRFLPNMQCRHSVLSIRHTVSGILKVNGETISFQDSHGYLEGDRGSSFPTRYLWTQCELDGDISVMLSIADIPYAGRIFTGIIGFVYMEGKEYRIATYLGAKMERMENHFVSVRQGELLLQEELIHENPRPLYAAYNGNMVRIIRESPCARVRYRLYKKGRAVFDLVGDCAGYENELGL